MSSNRLSKLTIVLVDDNPDVRRHVSAYLSHLGVKVAVAENAIEGLESVKTYRPNLVLSDISMPGRDGFELLRDIQALEPDGRDGRGRVPVIAMTALVTHLDRARILDAGFKAFLPKPFTPEALVRTILRAFDD